MVIGVRQVVFRWLLTCEGRGEGLLLPGVVNFPLLGCVNPRGTQTGRLSLQGSS